MSALHDYPTLTPPSPETETPIKQNWIQAHPYRNLILGTAFIIAVVGFVFLTRSGVTGSSTATNWIGAGSVFFTGGSKPTESERLTAEEIVRQRSENTKLDYIPITAPTTGDEGDDFGGDLVKLLAQLSAPASSGSTPTGEQPTASAFSFIPQGLISVNSGEKPRTATQASLAAYGNDIGAQLQAYDSLHGFTSTTLKDHAEDRTSPEKAEQVRKIGLDMAGLGYELLQEEEIPSEMKAAHSAYATSFRIAGTNLVKVAEAKTDEDFLSAINAYNESVQNLAKRYLAIVAIFAANNVTFSSTEAGSVFMFSGDASL